MDCPQREGRSRQLTAPRFGQSTGAFALMVPHANPPQAVQRKKVRPDFGISGRPTSVSLEHAFWDALREIAEAKATTRSGLIGEIKKTHSDANLSSAIRLFVLTYFMRQRR